MTPEVRVLDAREDVLRSDLLGRVPDALVYASPEFGRFLAAVAPGDGLCLAAFDGGVLRGVLPVFRARHSELGEVLNSLPWFGSHGGCTLADPADDATRRALLAAYAELASSPTVVASTLIASPAEEPARERYRELLEPRFTDGRIGQITPLPDPGGELDERLMATFRSKTRNLVRKSLRQGFTLDDRGDAGAWDFLYATHCENMQAIGGAPKPRSHFDAMRETLPADWLRLSVARLEGEAVAAMLLVRFQRTVEYVTPVIRVAHRPRQPLSFLIWHGMLASARDGFRWWNWGGTWRSQESLHHFKAGWGAVDRPYSYYVRVPASGLERLRAELPRYRDAFPFYYLAPYDALEGP